MKRDYTLTVIGNLDDCVIIKDATRRKRMEMLKEHPQRRFAHRPTWEKDAVRQDHRRMRYATKRNLAIMAL